MRKYSWLIVLLPCFLGLMACDMEKELSDETPRGVVLLAGLAVQHDDSATLQSLVTENVSHWLDQKILRRLRADFDQLSQHRLSDPVLIDEGRYQMDVTGWDPYGEADVHFISIIVSCKKVSRDTCFFADYCLKAVEKQCRIVDLK